MWLVSKLSYIVGHPIGVHWKLENCSVGKISTHLGTSGSMLAVESKGIEFFAFKRYDEEWRIKWHSINCLLFPELMLSSLQVMFTVSYQRLEEPGDFLVGRRPHNQSHSFLKGMTLEQEEQELWSWRHLHWLPASIHHVLRVQQFNSLSHNFLICQKKMAVLFYELIGRLG